MPYALFENDDQLSRAFATEAEVWKHADDAGLVSDDNGKPALEDDYVIKPCQEMPADQPAKEETPKQKAWSDKQYAESWQMPTNKRATFR